MNLSSRHHLILTCVLMFQVVTVLAQENPCEVPFRKMVDRRTGAAFQLSDAVNTNDKISPDSNAKYNYKNRFLVLNLDTKNEQGQCKGLKENYPMVDASKPPVDRFPELSDTGTLTHFVQDIQKHYRTPADKKPVVNLHGMNYCIGQTASLCEIRGNQVVEIARLGTSSLSANSAPNRATTYGEYNQISTRKWIAGVTYMDDDVARDIELGGPDLNRGQMYTRYVSGGGSILNNFMKWDGIGIYSVPSFYGGLHELSVGETNINNLGAPVSHGCLRLSRYGSIFARWWTPVGAKMFIYYTPKGYRQTP